MALTSVPAVASAAAPPALRLRDALPAAALLLVAYAVVPAFAPGYLIEAILLPFLALSLAGVGLNLVAADTVVLMDSWWAPAIEDQAVDRVHRLGQVRETKVWRLVMEDSVEERVLDVQARKRELVGLAFGDKADGKKARETRMADLAQLLG